MKRKNKILTMLAITCINSIVYDAILIKFIIPNFELNIKEPTHSAEPQSIKFTPIFMFHIIPYR